MENPEEVLQSLDEFAKLKPKDIPRELEEYLCYVAKTGDPVYQWSLVKCLFREKLLNVITDFYETCPTIDLPPCPNVDPFNYETMKRNLLERLDSFVNAPFTVQRLCELLTTPRKEYSRVDKFMRAVEKNILVVSTREPGNTRRSDVMQPEFLMNGVMDGRGIDIGEAIETVSSDGVNLMHGDDTEVNISDSGTIRIDCSGAEEIDMDDHPDVEAPNESVWDKDGETTTSVDEDCVKEYEGGGDPDTENEPKITSEVNNTEDVESESKEPDSPDVESEGFSETVDSDQNVHSATRETNDSEETSGESQNIHDECKKTKSNIGLDDKIDSEPVDSLSEAETVSEKADPEDEDALKEKPPEDVDSPDPNLTAVEETVPETTKPADEDEERETRSIEEDEKEKDASTIQNDSVAEANQNTDNVEDLSPLESLEEVTSNISPDLDSKVEVNAVETVSAAVDTGEKSQEKEESDLEAKTEVVTEECETNTSIVDVEPQEQMEVDDINQVSVVVQEDEPMDQSEQLCSES